MLDSITNIYCHHYYINHFYQSTLYFHSLIKRTLFVSRLHISPSIALQTDSTANVTHLSRTSNLTMTAIHFSDPKLTSVTEHVTPASMTSTGVMSVDKVVRIASQYPTYSSLWFHFILFHILSYYFIAWLYTCSIIILAPFVIFDHIHSISCELVVLIDNVGLLMEILHEII